MAFYHRREMVARLRILHTPDRESAAGARRRLRTLSDDIYSQPVLITDPTLVEL